MKIIQLVTSLDDGGAETLVKDYSIKLEKKNQEVLVVVVFNYTKSSNYRLLRDANINYLPLVRNYNIISRLFLRLFGKWYIPYRLKKCFKVEKPDVVHIHLELLKYVAKIANYFPATKFFFTCHSEPYRKLGPQYPGELEAAKEMCAANRLQVIALHNDMRLKLNKMLDIDNTKVLYNCISVKHFSNCNVGKNEVRAKILVPKDAILIGHVGRFSEPKNHEFIIKVFYEASKQNNKAMLLLVGDGDLLQSVKNKVHQLGIEKKVIFLSHRSDVPELMKAMDLFLFPSIIEGFPVTLIEAQAIGLPCLISNTITPEVCISKNVVSMDLDKSAAEWASQLLSMYGMITYDKRIENFDWDNVIDKLINLYKQ